MDKVSEKLKSNKRTREDRNDRRDSDEKRSSRDDKHRDSDKRHSSHHHHHQRSDRESKNDRSRDHRSRSTLSPDEREGEDSYDRDFKRERSYDLREDREGSRDRDLSKRERRKESREKDDDYERERSSELHWDSAHSNKRKEREGSKDRADGGEKRVKVSDDKKERRRFEAVKEMNGVEREERKEGRRSEDRVEDGELNLNVRGERRERRRFGDNEGKLNFSEEKVNGEVGYEVSSTINGSGSLGNGSIVKSLTMASRSVPETSLSSNHPLPTKVSSISTTNENKGVSITRSHQVPGKSSTDGISSTAGKSGSFSLDALAKAKKALQKHKDLSQKIKKVPLLNKGSGSQGSLLKETTKAPVFYTGILGSVPPKTATIATSSSTLPPPPSGNATTSGISAPAGITSIPNIEAVKRAQELAARMGFRQDPEFAPIINMFPGQATTDVAVPQKPTKVPVLRLDALGREIDEHGNVVGITKPSNLSTLKVNINKQKKDAFQILKPELEVDPESNPHYDERMGLNKNKILRPKRMSFQFVEEGKWSKEAEHIKLKSKYGEAQAKERREKQAQLAKAKAAPDINPNLIELSERVIMKEKPKDPIPDIECWDKPLLQSGTYDDIIDGTIPEEKLRKDKITIYVEHPRPIEPPAEPAPPPPQPLKLTKKEQKKLRTQRRLAQEKERQEMIRQGLIEPPKPKVKMSNLMKVLGSEATQDPTRLEKEIRTAAAEREQAHIDRNIARKLTPAERREKKERKLFDGPGTLETVVSIYKISDLSNLKARFKVDINARENRLTGCAVISDGMSVVVVEGGNKTIKRYSKLMLKRIDWASAVKEEEEEDEEEDEDKPVNKCVLVWQGSVARPSFYRFSIHECITEAAARKVFADAGIGHYWDLAVNFSDDQV